MSSSASTTASAEAASPSGVSARPDRAEARHQSFWLWVMCLTGVDYFSTLAYQPSIAFEAMGQLAPLATLVLVGLTLAGALPIYKHVASRSPNGLGSLGMLERLLHGWTGKLVVLIVLGFAATDLVITQTLSAADAAKHIIQNPYWRDWSSQVGISPDWEVKEQCYLTIFLLLLLGAIFLRGFREVIVLAVILVSTYMLLNLTIIGSGLVYLLREPRVWDDWWSEKVLTGKWDFQAPDWARPSAWHIAALCFLFFPKLALGLSGFETGVAVMPLIRGEGENEQERLTRRIANTRKLLMTAALVMSFYLIGSSVVVSLLIEPHEFGIEGRARDRALAYLAHGEGIGQRLNPLFGQVFGTIYDISTISILWFASASAMAGLLNLVPQYLPRYGMAPQWARAIRPLVILFTGINLLVTWIFEADVSAQGGAYATGVLVLMTSACVAGVVDRWPQATYDWSRWPWTFLVITGVFVYTTIAVVIEKPSGMVIASCFIAGILITSFASRALRSTELRFIGFQFYDEQSRFLWDSMRHIEFPVLVPHRPGRRDLASKEESIRKDHHLGPEIPIVFIEAEIGDPSEFEQAPVMQVVQEQGRFVIRVTRCASIAHVIAVIGLELSRVGRPPEIHFGWSDESPFAANLSFLLFGEGNIPWMVRELIRKAEPDPDKQPRVVIG